MHVTARLPSGIRVARVSEIVGAMMRRGAIDLSDAVDCADEGDDGGLFASAAIAFAAAIDRQTRASLGCMSSSPLVVRWAKKSPIIALRASFFH